MTRRLVGKELIQWHLSKSIKGINVDPDDPQYKSDHINPYVYNLARNCIINGEISKRRMSVIEFGARAGYLGKILSTEMKNVVYSGVEPYPPDDKLFNILHESCESMIESSICRSLLRKTGLVIYADVLEHIIDPWSHLRKIYDLVDYGTDLVISIPNFFHHSALSLISEGRFIYEEWGVLDLTHLRFFGIRDMVDMLRLTGWSVVESSITPAMDPEGYKLLSQFRNGEMETWSHGRLKWTIRTEQEALELAAYQFVLVAKKTC